MLMFAADDNNIFDTYERFELSLHLNILLNYTSKLVTIVHLIWTELNHVTLFYFYDLLTYINSKTNNFTNLKINLKIIHQHNF